MTNSSVKKIITPTVLPLQNTYVTEWSEFLSSTFKAQLLLYNAIKTESAGAESATSGNTKINDMLKSALTVLQDIGNSLDNAHQVSYVVEVSNNWKNLIRQIQDEGGDLMVTKMPSIGETTPGKLTALMYNSPCPVFFVREGMQPAKPKKILVPIRKKDGLESLLPTVINWAKKFNSTICLSTFEPDGGSAKDWLRLMQRAERMAESIRMAGVKLETESAHGYHFGTTALQRVGFTGADMVVISVQPTNYITRLFNKMVGPYFLEHSPVPVLSIPIENSVNETLDTPANDMSSSIEPDAPVSLSNS